MAEVFLDDECCEILTRFKCSYVRTIESVAKWQFYLRYPERNIGVFCVFVFFTDPGMYAVSYVFCIIMKVCMILWVCVV